MQNVSDLSKIIPHKGLIDIIGYKSKKRMLTPLSKSMSCLISAASQCIDAAVQPLFIFLHQDIDQKTPDQPGGTGNENSLILEAVPGETQICCPLDIFQI